MKQVMQVAVGCALGAMLALIAWHGLVRWLPWWAQGLIGASILCGLLAWACCIIAGRADRAMEAGERAWRDNPPRVLGEDVPARICGVIRRGQCDYFGKQ
jgi:hypothetical protein